MNTEKIYAESIVNEYSPKDTSKVVALKKLDRKAKLPSDIFGYTFGSVSSLVLGVGMCLAMGVIGAGNAGAMVAGIIIGLVGIVGMSLCPVLFKKIRAKGMAKYSNDIMLLAKEIAEQE